MRALEALATRCRQRGALAIFIWLALLSFGAGCSSAVADEPTLKLRLAWGGGAERTWRGTIALSAGTLSNPQPLGLEPDEAGSIWLNEAGAVEVRSPSPRTYDGCDIEVRADLTAKLRIALAGDGEPMRPPLEIELSSLVKDSQFRELDSRKNRLLVRRVPGDALRVRMEPEGAKPGDRGPRRDNPPLTMVFAPGQWASFQVRPHVLGVESSPALWVRSQLQTAREKLEVWNREQEAPAPMPGEGYLPVGVSFQVPAEPGVYDLVLTAYKKEPPAKNRLFPIVGGREILNRLGQRGEPLAERRVQFIVFEPTPAPADKRPGPPGTELMAINPAKSWWERVAHMPRIPGLGKEPLEHGSVERWEHPQLGPLVLLRGGDRDQVSGVRGEGEKQSELENWVAYPLSVSQPGEVHVVEVDYPSDMPQAMTISVVEPNASGTVVPIGLDSGVYVPPAAVDQPPRLAKHRLTFWPRTREPLLLISRVSGAPRAAHGKIRLLGPKRYGVGMIRLPMDAHSALPPAAPPMRNPERLVIGLMERPLFPENFGASESFDPWSGGSLDDWTTFYDGGRRMLEYAQHVGYNALIVAALADGSTIYPSQYLAPTPRYDTGAFFSTGQDPARKDVLELLLRQSNREGMLLIPLLQFSAPLPELEAIGRRSPADAVGLQLVGSSGATWMEKHGSRRGQYAYYNPLDPRVQQAIRNVVRELAERYGQHPSFGGIALGSSGPCGWLLPGVEWGLDDGTFARFCQAKGVNIAADGPGRFAARAKAVSGPHRQAWLAWRAEVIHAFHAQLRADLAAVRREARLIVLTGGMLQGSDAEAAMRPALPPRMGIEELPLTAGLNPQLYRQDEAIVLLRPRQVSAPDTARTLAVNLTVGDAPELDNVFREAASSGNLLVHAPLRSRLATFDARSPFGADKTLQSLLAHLATGAPFCRQRFIQTLNLDSPVLVDGGWMLTMGEEQALTPLLLTLRRLPVGDYQPVAGESQGITCRWLSRGGETFLYVVNPTPWPCKANLTMRGDEQAGLMELSQLRQPPQHTPGALALNLEPYDLVAVRFRRPTGMNQPPEPAADNQLLGISFSNLVVSFDPAVRESLNQRIRDLVTRASVLAEPRRADVLANPDFELPADGARNLPGWTLAGGEGSLALADAEIKHGGRLSARLSSQRGVASLISDPFAAPQTGRISIAVRLRTVEQGPVPVLRLALGGKLDGADYYRFAEAPVDATWRYFIFTVDNLPLGGLSELQVRFDLMGAGQAWIDDVAVSDLALSENERAELRRIATRAQFALEDGRLADCVRLLEGYWPRFLEDNVPVAPGQGVATDRTARAPAADAAEQSPAAESKPPWWQRGIPNVFR